MPLGGEARHRPEFDLDAPAFEVRTASPIGAGHTKHSGVPDLAYERLHVVDGGELVAFHTLVRGTHTGMLFGLPPTGRRFLVRQMQIERLRDGRIVEHWRVTDEAALTAQLTGARPDVAR